MRQSQRRQAPLRIGTERAISCAGDFRRSGPVASALSGAPSPRSGSGLDLAQIQATQLVGTRDNPSKNAREDEALEICQRLDVAMDRESALNIFNAQQTRGRRMAEEKRAARRAVGVERAKAAQKKEQVRRISN